MRLPRPDVRSAMDSLLYTGRKELGYVLALLASATLVARSFGQAVASTKARPRVALAAAAHAALALAALYLTWSEILRFIAEDVADPAVGGGSLRVWLGKSNVFVRAYWLVANGAGAWWWSSQLLLWVCSAMLFVRAEAARSAAAVPSAAYALLGLLGAISLAVPLFLADTALRRAAGGAEAQQQQQLQRRSKSPGRVAAGTTGAMPLACVFACAVGLGCAAVLRAMLVPGQVAPGLWTPFGAALIVLHDVLLVTVLWPDAARSSPMALRRVYLASAVFGSLAHAANWRAHGAAGPTELWLAGPGSASPCVSSISTDVVLTSLTCAFFVAAEEGLLPGWGAAPPAKGASASRGVACAAAFVASLPLLGLAGAFPLYLWRREARFGERTKGT